MKIAVKKIALIAFIFLLSMHQQNLHAMISGQDYDLVINNPAVDFAYIPEDIKTALRMFKAQYPEIDSLIDLTWLIDQDTHITPRDTLLTFLEQLLATLANAEYPATKLLTDLKQYAQELQAQTVQVHIDQDNLSDGKRTIFLYNTNNGSAFSAAANINIVGGSNITATGAGSTITIGMSGSVSTSFSTDSGTATPSNDALTIHGGSNMNTSGTGAIVTVNLNNSPSVSGSFTAGTGLIATTGGINATGNSSISGGTITLNSGTNALNVSTDSANTTVSIATGNAAKTTTFGSTNTSSITSIQAGTGNIVLTGSTNGIAITGTATATTQSANDDSTKLATTAYIDNSNPYRLLSTQTVSNVSAVTFINLPTAYTKFLVRWYNVVPATSGSNIQLQWSNNNGSSWIGSGYYGIDFFSNSAGTFSTTVSNNASSLAISQAVIVLTNYSSSGEILFTNIGASQTIYPNCYGRSTSLYNNTTTTKTLNSMSGGSVNTAGCNAFHLFFSSGNIASGTFELYAVL